MRIDGILMKDVETIENNYDNLEILKIIKYLIGVVVNDVEYMNNDIELFNDKDFDLGNNHIIKSEDLESLCSILDTINNIENCNKEV